MKPTIQPGMHPDAEILSAFAEELVSTTEREEILAHMAVCGRCREVVFFARRAADAKEPAAEKPRVAETGTGWFAGWRWAWVPMAALGGMFAVAVVQHVRHASVEGTRMAQNAGPAEPMQSTGLPRAARGPQESSQEPSSAQSKQQPERPERSRNDRELRRKSLDEKDVAATAKKEDQPARNSDALSAPSAKLSGGNEQGGFEARAKSSGVGGPLAQNQVQAQNNAQMQQENYAKDARQATGLADSVNKPLTSKTEAGAGSGTAAAELSGRPLPISPAPPAAPAIAAAQMERESAGGSEGKLAKDKAGNSTLPSKLGVLSTASAGKRMIAIDTRGSLFLSEDAGQHWQSVRAQWAGRAVLVKVRSTVGLHGELQKRTSAQFELTTDQLESWSSEDGKTWKLETASGK